jgi:hypothetical protein
MPYHGVHLSQRTEQSCGRGDKGSREGKFGTLAEHVAREGWTLIYKCQMGKGKGNSKTLYIPRCLAIMEYVSGAVFAVKVVLEVRRKTCVTSGGEGTC